MCQIATEFGPSIWFFFVRQTRIESFDALRGWARDRRLVLCCCAGCASSGVPPVTVWRTIPACAGCCGVTGRCRRVGRARKSLTPLSGLVGGTPYTRPRAPRFGSWLHRPNQSSGVWSRRPRLHATLHRSLYCSFELTLMVSSLLITPAPVTMSSMY